jgi:glycosyltransferase involved in cell wall biosynthesis
MTGCSAAIPEKALETVPSRGSEQSLLAGRSVAIVHEWFSAAGGSETVFRRIAEVLPQAERFVLWRERDATGDGFPVRESWLARTPLRRSKVLALPVMPLAWRTLSRDAFDVVLSSSHAFAHLVRFGANPDTRYLSYVHSPARYVWSPGFDGRGANPALAGVRKALQVADVRLSRHVHSYAANSHEVRARIQRFWRRDAHVIHPPVDVDYFAAAPLAQRTRGRDYLLGAGRFIGYKNFGLILRIAEAARTPLVLAGSGPDHEALRAVARRLTVPVTFELRPSTERLRELYWGAKALVFPVHEDFGMIPVEAQACGTPVLGLGRGGLLETVQDGQTGFLVDSLEPDRYAELVGKVHTLDPAFMQANAARFARPVFAARLRAWIEQELR